MAGWLIVWAAPGKCLDRGRWDRSIRAAGRYGEPVAELLAGEVGVAAWRRGHGEFPLSGMLHRQASGAVVAWVGQCLSDGGDGTRQAIDSLARFPADFMAAASLNGVFAAAVLDPRAHHVGIWTDRHRHYPVYVCRGSGFRVASTDLACLVPWLARPRIDGRAVSLLLCVGELIDCLTPVEGVEFLPPATLLEDSGGGLTERQYWKLDFRPKPERSEKKWADEVACALKAAIRRIEAAGARLGVPLSGGLDSRLLLGLCSRPSSVPSFTWGLPGCRDLRYAAQFARSVGSPHRTYDWRPAEYPPMWAEGVERTAGAFGIQDMFVLPYARRLGEHCQAVLNGLAGDALLGGNFLKQAWVRETDLGRLAETAWRWRTGPEQEAHAQCLLGRRTQAVRDSRQLWIESICSEPGRRPVERLHAWLMDNRVFRFTNCGTMLLRGAVESYAPFFDRDLVDLLVTVPLELRWKHRLYLRVLKRACPAAARVRWQRTAVPPAWGFGVSLSAMAAHRAARLVCKPLRVEPFRRQTVADVAGWMRAEWAPAVEDILLDERTLDRGMVEPDTLRELCREHRQGHNHARQLGALVALEIFARTVLEPAPAALMEPARS
jgi:asparagine synthase (glutamine-hydrolysing)